MHSVHICILLLAEGSNGEDKRQPVLVFSVSYLCLASHCCDLHLDHSAQIQSAQIQGLLHLSPHILHDQA